MGNIYQMHIDRLQIGLLIFVFRKLLTHSSAAYYPTLCQKTQQRLLSVMAGKLRSMKFFRFPRSTTSSSSNGFFLSPSTRVQLHSAPIASNSSLAQNRRKRKSLTNLNWKKTKKEFLRKKSSDTDVFKRSRKNSN